MRPQFMKALLGFLAVAATATSAASRLTAGIIDVEGAIVGGHGCSKETTQIFLDDRGGLLDMQVSLQDMLAELSMNQLADRRSCVLRIPVSIPPGYQLTLLSSTADFTRAAQSEFDGQASLTHSLLGEESVPAQVDLSQSPDNSISLDQPQMLVSKCSPEVQNGFLGVNMAMSLQATSVVPLVYVKAEQLLLAFNLTACAPD